MSLIVKCPHCDDYVEIMQLNCAIFRHGVYKKNNQQMHPHSPKYICDDAIQNNLIYGCGKPFQIINEVAVVCEYV